MYVRNVFNRWKIRLSGNRGIIGGIYIFALKSLAPQMLGIFAIVENK